MWSEADDIFFTRHASHILAFVFKQLHQDEGRYETRHLRPRRDAPGNLVYVSDGHWAFWAGGWILEAELLDGVTAAHLEVDPNWDYELVAVPDGLEDFCARSYFRPPAYFLHLPWERTYEFISQFGAGPPDEVELDASPYPSSSSPAS